MKTRTKKKSTVETTIIENPVGESGYNDRVSESWQENVADVIESGRNSTYDVIAEMMVLTFEEVIAYIRSKGITEEEIKRQRAFISNIPTTLIGTMYSKSTEGPIRDYALGKDKPIMMMNFLDVRNLQKQALQIDYKKAYEKWTTEEELTLTGMYNSGKSWHEIAEALERNVNSVKIRAEKLGIAENTGAKRRY